MDSDKIIVMDKGTVAEFDTPANLIDNENSFLYKLVKDTGKSSTEHLKNIAKKRKIV